MLRYAPGTEEGTKWTLIKNLVRTHIVQRRLGNLTSFAELLDVRAEMVNADNAGLHSHDTQPTLYTPQITDNTPHPSQSPSTRILSR